MHYKIILFLTILFISACVERYYPKLDKYENLLVVDAIITNAPPPYKVTLSISSSVTNPKQIQVSGAEVIISDDLGNHEILTENEEGIYYTSAHGMRAIAGRSYMLTINYDEKTYQSGYQLLRRYNEIIDVYPEIAYKEDNEGFVYPGLQFYVKTELTSGEDNYFLWQLTETYKYNADFLIDLIWTGYMTQITNRDTLRTCWKTSTIPAFYTYHNPVSEDLEIDGIPIAFVDTRTKRLTQRYSLLIRQFTTDYKTYNYWKQIQEGNSAEGSLYPTQPYQISGNMQNVDNPDETVLGFFTVASFSEKRIFVDRPAVDFYYPLCGYIRDPLKIGWIYQSPPDDWTEYIEITSSGKATGADECFDCRESGGKLEKPDFWED